MIANRQTHKHIHAHAHTHTRRHTHTHTHTHTHIRLTALFPGLPVPGWAGTRKVKPIWILLKQETVSGNGISWAICKSAPGSRQIAPAPHNLVFFTGRMPFLPPNEHRRSTEGTSTGPQMKSISTNCCISKISVKYRYVFY